VAGSSPRGTKSGRSGIGLAVVKELVTAHGGTVTADSAPGGGTRMAFRLPMADARRSGASRGTRTLPDIAPQANTHGGI